MKDPTCIALSYEASRLKFTEGAKNPITFLDIIELDSKSSSHLKTLSVHLILKFLIDAEEFDFDNYKHKDSAVFSRPTSPCQLKVSPDMVTCQYMLDLLHIEETSYEGNDRVLQEWFRLLNVDPTGQQPLIWVSDQLTIGQIRGLKKFRCMDNSSWDHLEFLKPVFGWFHAQIAMEHSLHSQYYGTCTGACV
jgi:hypothetical protein